MDEDVKQQKTEIMELKFELEKLKVLYNNNNVSEFKEQYKRITENFTSASDIAVKEQFMDTLVNVSMQENDRSMEEIRIRYQLISNREIIPFSYIARNYFNKSRTWLYQRINRNTVNGKPAEFSPTEAATFNHALQDISKRLGSITI